MNSIANLRNTMEQIRSGEVARHSKKLTSNEAAHIDQVTRNFIESVVQLIGRQTDDSEELARSIEMIFSRATE